MKTLSNAELQDAIRYSTECIKNSGSASVISKLHQEQLVDLLYEQRRRASERVELTIEPMTTTLDRVNLMRHSMKHELNKKLLKKLDLYLESVEPDVLFADIESRYPASKSQQSGEAMIKLMQGDCMDYMRSLPVKAQDGPEWVDHDLSDDMPVSRNTTVEVQFEDGQRHGGCAKDFVWTDIDDETNIARYRVWSSSEEKE